MPVVGTKKSLLSVLAVLALVAVMLPLLASPAEAARKRAIYDIQGAGHV